MLTCSDDAARLNPGECAFARVKFNGQGDECKECKYAIAGDDHHQRCLPRKKSPREKCAEHHHHKHDVDNLCAHILDGNHCRTKLKHAISFRVLHGVATLMRSNCRGGCISSMVYLLAEVNRF